MHRYWECKKLSTAFKEDEPIKNSAYLAKSALLSWQSCPIYYTRGCVPTAWTTRAPIPEVTETCIIGESTRYNRTYYTDGSGGKTGKDKRMRACGWAAVAITTGRWADDPLHPCMYRPTPTHALFGTVGGKEQTVPRAQLNACIELLADQTSDGDHICND